MKGTDRICVISILLLISIWKSSPFSVQNKPIEINLYKNLKQKKKQSFVWVYRHDAGTKIYLYKEFIFAVCKMCKMENEYQNTYC